MPQDIDILDPVPAPLTQDVSARTKAAIVVRFLMQEGAEIDLAALPTSLQADLTREIANLRLIDRATLAEVIEEFAHELDSIGLTPNGDWDQRCACLRENHKRHSATSATDAGCDCLRSLGPHQTVG
jgi:hypothetical protein